LRGIAGDRDTVVVVGWDGRSYRSTDGGETWTETLVRGADGQSAELAALWAGADGTFVTAGNTLARSTDGGASFATVASAPGFFYALGGLPQSLFAVGAPGTSSQILRSLDGGATFTPVSLSDPPAGALVDVDPVEAGGFLALDEAGCLYSSRDGATWQRMAHCSEAKSPGSLWAGPQGELLLSGANTSRDAVLWRSVDSGSTWVRLLTLYGGTLRAAVHDPETGYFAVGDSGLLMHSPDGKAWSRIGVPDPLTAKIRVAGRPDLFGVGASSVDDLYAVGEAGAIFHSTDGGVTWDETRQGGGTLLDLEADGDGAIAVGENGTVLRSTDHGLSWSPVPSETWRSLRRLWLGSDGLVVVVGDGGVVLRSDDHGVSFEPVAVPTDKALRGVAGVDQVVVAAGDGGTVLFSSDGGASWTQAKSPATTELHGIWTDGRRVVVVGAHAQAFTSVDRGNTWIGGAALPESADADLLAVWGAPGHLYAVGTVHGVLESTDLGASWTEDSDPWLADRDLEDIWGDAAGAVFVVGTAKALARL
jgi:photosystem II stability/assembly factor-like uncharacterized protein